MEQARNAIEAVTHPDPYPWYRALREERPLFFDGQLGLWVASSLAAVSGAFAHPQLRVRPPSEPVPKTLVGTVAGEVFAQLVRMTDGDFHAQHKPGVERAARRWSMQDVAAAAQAAARDLRPRVDANAFASALPVQAMARLLGVQDAALDLTCQRVAQFVAGIGPGASGQVVADAVTAAQALLDEGLAQGQTVTESANRIAFMQQSLVWLRDRHELRDFFGKQAGFRPLGNARVPMFS